MPVARHELETLGRVARATLAEDLATYGGRAIGLSRVATRALLGAGVPVHRADVLHAWLRSYGTRSPLRDVPREPREERGAAVAGRAANRAPEAVPETRRLPPTHIVFGDCHAAPDQDLRRFREMGEIVRREYDRARAEGRDLVLVQIGDWYSFDSLCEHESSSRRSESRFREEVEAGEIALEAFHAGLGAPSITALPGLSAELTLGNHDVRVDRLVDGAPWFDGFYSVGAAHEARGWRVTPFLTSRRVDGIRYAHYLTGRGGRKAIGGVNHARTLLARVRHQESVVVGHSHALVYASEAAHTGVRRHAIVVGCWLDAVEGYAGEDNEEWFSGYVVLRGVVDGDFASMEVVRRAPAARRAS